MTINDLQMGADVEVRTSTGWHRSSVSRVKIVMDRPMLRTITVTRPVDSPVIGEPITITVH